MFSLSQTSVARVALIIRAAVSQGLFIVRFHLVVSSPNATLPAPLVEISEVALAADLALNRYGLTTEVYTTSEIYWIIKASGLLKCFSQPSITLKMLYLPRICRWSITMPTGSLDSVFVFLGFFLTTIG